MSQIQIAFGKCYYNFL